MSSTRILLTGGTGFFGKSLLHYYLSQPYSSFNQIVVLSRNPEQFLRCYPEFDSSPHISFVRGDIQKRASLPWEKCFTHVLHAATESTIGPTLSPLERYIQIVEGTRNILDLAVHTGASRFLLTSSGAIYGSQPSDLQAIPEDWPGTLPLDNPTTAYGQGKRASEHLCALYSHHYRIDTIVARCFAFVGSYLPLDAHFAIGNFIRDALTSETIKVSGDGSPVRSYLDQKDLAHWLFTLLEYGSTGEAYNVGSDELINISAYGNITTGNSNPFDL